MEKAKKIINILLIILILIFLLIAITYFIVDTHSTLPEDIKNDFDTMQEKFMGRQIFVIKPKEEEKRTDKKILYFHGGSYMAEVTQAHWNFLKQVVQDTGATIILPDYPLTPKYNYKNVFQMVVPLYKEIIEKVNPKTLIVMGDSAGGGLALALEEKIGEENVEMPSQTLLISPWLDVRLNNPEIEKVEEKDKQLNKEALQVAGIAYAGKDGINSYLVNPIEGDLSKLKNITVFIGTDDILNPDVKLLQQKFKEQENQKQNSQGTQDSQEIQEQQTLPIEVKEYEQAGHIWIIDKNSNQEIVQKGYQDLIEKIVTINS